MEIALSGALPVLPQPQRQPPPQAQPRQTDTAASRQQANSQNAINRTEREVTGQVVNDEAETYTETRSESGTASNNSQNFTPSQTRRHSRQASVQTYADNQALIAHPSQPRQVSGIIDVRV